MKLDINNPEHRVQIQDVLRQGAEGEFWQVICQRLQEHIDSVQTQLDSSELENLPAAEYKTLNEVLKSKKRDRIGIIDMPEVLVRELDSPDFFERKRDEEVYEELEEQD